MSVVEQRALFRTRMTLPGEWKVDRNGMIHPKSFMDLSRLEQIFKSPSRYSYFLAQKIEGHVEMQFTHARKVFMPDKELREIVRNMSRRLFGCEDVRGLDVKSRIDIAKRLRYDYASTVKQISRMVGLDEERLSTFI